MSRATAMAMTAGAFGIGLAMVQSQVGFGTPAVSQRAFTTALTTDSPLAGTSLSDVMPKPKPMPGPGPAPLPTSGAKEPAQGSS